MIRVNIILKDNNGGLKQDADIISQVLTEANFQVSIYKLGSSTLEHKLYNLTTQIQGYTSQFFKRKPLYDINIFLETIFTEWIPFATINCLIPNQEWFKEKSIPTLSQMDYVLCKTKYAQDIFSKLGCQTEFISFTSYDRFVETAEKDYNSYFHVAGSNKGKGTKKLIHAWYYHPEWSPIFIRQNWIHYQVPASNIKYLKEFMDDELLREYQNKHGVHLCPSRAEGFGHSIVEAMSTKAVVLTTNALPMNEIVTLDRGLLIDYDESYPHGLGMHYVVDVFRLQEKVLEVIDMDYSRKKELGENARTWYLDNDRFFKHKLVEFLRNV